MGEFPFTYEDLKLSYPALLDKFYEAISQHCYGLSKEYEHNLLNIPEFLLAMLYSVVSDVPNYPYDFYEVRDCVKSNLKGIDQRYIDVHCDGWMDSAWNSLKAEIHWQKLYVKDLPELMTNPFTFDEVMSLEKFELRSRYLKRGPYAMSRESLQCQLSSCIMKMACEVIPSQSWSGFNFGSLISEMENILEKDGFLRKHFGELFVDSFLNSASILLKSSTESWEKDFKGLKIRAPRNLSLSMLRTVIYELEKRENLN